MGIVLQGKRKRGQKKGTLFLMADPICEVVGM